ncbi:MAG: helix-turn-helix domain-containing protein [Ruminococcus sp.]
MNFPEKLRELRQANGLSQKKLAEKLGVAQSSINYWEKGQRVPSSDAIQKIADFFKLTTDELLGYKYLGKISDKKFYGKEASPEEQQKFMERLFEQKKGSDKRKDLDKKIDQFNDDGIQIMSDCADLIMKISEYRKDTE